jgi:hypothetical protein
MASEVSFMQSVVAQSLMQSSIDAKPQRYQNNTRLKEACF